MTKPGLLNILVLIVFLSSFAVNSSLAQNKNSKPHKQVDIYLRTSEPAGCNIDTLRLFEWSGVQVDQIAKAVPALNKSGNTEFHITLKNVALGNYYIGRIVNNSMSDMKPLILGTEDKVVIKCNCADMKYTIEESKINLAFDVMLDSIKVHSNEFFNTLTNYQQNLNSPDVAENFKKKLGEIDLRRKDYFNKMKKEHPELAMTLALYTYQSFQNHKKDAQQSEGQYIAENYFQFAELSDTNYVRIAFFYEAVKGYATNIANTGITSAQLESSLDELLAKIGNNKPHYRSALLAVNFGVMATNKKLFVKYTDSYLKLYRGQNLSLDGFLDNQLFQLKSSTEIGDEAPDISAPTPDGKSLNLKSLRGKVLLVDFWASWCGPCRRENPHVVSVYNKYKSKGFDVLGVSLDNDKQKWINAIAQDGLVWNHISDLGGWSAAPAKLYKVTGIPQTFLLDKNGVIIAKNLRGDALEQKLKEIFGE